MKCNHLASTARFRYESEGRAANVLEIEIPQSVALISLCRASVMSDTTAQLCSQNEVRNQERSSERKKEQVPAQTNQSRFNRHGSKTELVTH